MRRPRDTFLKLVADNIGDGITVHPVRRDPDNRTTSNMQMNAINIGFGRVDLGVLLSSIAIKIDVIADSELAAMDMTQQLWLLLSAQMYTPLLDYTDPANPVDTGTTLMWRRVRFVPVESDAYYQYSATITAQYHNQLPQ